jgi:hypothetical protein
LIGQFYSERLTSRIIGSWADGTPFHTFSAEELPAPNNTILVGQHRGTGFVFSGGRPFEVGKVGV